MRLIDKLRSAIEDYAIARISDADLQVAIGKVENELELLELERDFLYDLFIKLDNKSVPLSKAELRKLAQEKQTDLVCASLKQDNIKSAGLCDFCSKPINQEDRIFTDVVDARLYHYSCKSYKNLSR
jgi:hypothetical protein